MSSAIVMSSAKAENLGGRSRFEEKGGEFSFIIIAQGCL